MRRYLNATFLAGLLFIARGANATDLDAFINFETPVVHPVDLSPDGTTLAVCNLPDGRIEFFDVTAEVPEPLGSVPVGVDPVSVRWRTENVVWVVNHISDSVSIVSRATMSVLRTLPTGDEPCDVVFAGEPLRAFVSCSQVNAIQVFDLSDLSSPPTTVSIVGEDPRALAASPDGLTVYAAIFESGNGSTILGGNAEIAEGVLQFPPNVVDDPEGPYGGLNPPPNSGMVFDPPLAPGLPPPPGVSLIIKKDADGRWLDDNIGDWTEFVTGAKADRSGRYPGWDLVDHDVAIIDANTLDVSYATHLMNLVMAIAVNPANGKVLAVGTDATNEVRFEPNISGRFLRVLAGLFSTNTETAMIDSAVTDLNPHLDYGTPTIAQTDRDKSIGDPRGVVWNAAGTQAYITGMGSNNLIVVDTNGDRIGDIAPIELEEGPTGVAIDNERNRLYVLNRFASSISVVDIEERAAVATVPMFDPTPDAIRVGRKHLYDTHKNSGLGHIACASCHIDSRMDRLAWDLGDPTIGVKPLDFLNLGMDFPALAPVSKFGPVDPPFTPFHPMKGPMTTQTLQDIIGKEPLHWRGDRLGLEEFNGAFMGLQGDDAMLTPQEMQEFEGFLATIAFPPNPFRNLDNALPEDLPLPGHYRTGRFGSEGEPLPNGNARRGLGLYRRGMSVFRPPGAALPIDQGAFSCVFCHTLPTGMGADFRADFSAVDPFNPATYLNFVWQPLPPGPLGERHHALVSVDGSKQKAFKIPQLRNQFDKTGFETTTGNISTAGFGFLHDGSVDSLSRFLSEPAFNVLDDQQVADLVALILAFSGSDYPVQLPSPETPVITNPPGTPSHDAHAAIGKQTVIDSAKLDVGLIGLMMALAQEGRVDLIAHGLDESGFNRGYKYTTGGAFDTDALGILTTYADLLASPQIETLTVVKRGAGTRLALDRDEDGLYNRDETRDYDPDTEGIQNPFHPANPDSTGDNGEAEPDGLADALNDWDGDGMSNRDEILAGRSPVSLDVTADIDASGGVDAIDVQLVINAALGIEIAPMSGDVNGSGAVDATDVQIVINAALGI